jgi:hypothetical protein
VQNSSNLLSHTPAALNEQAVAHAEGSITVPQLPLHPAPVDCLQAADAALRQEPAQLSRHACTGSAAGLLSGTTITSGTGAETTTSGTFTGCATIAASPVLLTVMSRGLSPGSWLNTTLPVGARWHAESRSSIIANTLQKACNDIQYHHSEECYADE